MDFGAFILGILFGWLLEWLYVTFFSSKGSDMGDCTAFERELKTRNEEIKSLKSQLSGSSQGGASLLSKGLKQSTASVSTASSKSKLNKSKAKATTKSTKSIKASAPSNTAGAGKKAAATTKKGSGVKKPTTTKGTTKSAKPKASLKKTATTTSTVSSATKASEKKAVSAKSVSKTVKKAAAKDPAAKNTVVKKKPAAKKISLKKDIKLNNPTGDDLTKLSGIGPSMAATLGELGITSYKKLAAMDDDILRDMLEASGARLNNNKDAMDSWNEQAMLADKGDFKGLKALQDSLKS